MVGFWNPVSIFKDQTVFLLGGGPSLRDVDVELLREQRVVAINNSVYLAPWAHVLFFRDLKWYFENTDAVFDFDGIVITTCVSIYKANVVKMFHSDSFIDIGNRGIRYGRSAGHIALSLAVSLGAKRVVLLGYDCRIVNGRSHFHDRVKQNGTAQTRFLYENDFLPAWNGWNSYCIQADVEVLNATPGSAIKEFPFRPLDEILSK